MNATDKAQFASEDNFLVEQLRLENWWLREALRKLEEARNPVAPLGGRSSRQIGGWHGDAGFAERGKPR